MSRLEPVQIARIAFRQEGDMWVAYFAKKDTMDGAVVMGSLSMSLARFADVKESFMDTICNAATLIEREASGLDVEFTEAMPAPESERSGNA